MRIIATHYGDHDISWIPEVSGGDYVIYDRSECGLPNRIPRENWGDADYDRLSYLVDNYYNLPEVFMLIKSNLFKYITPEEFERVKDNTDYTPLLTQNHKTYSDERGTVCFYQDGMYYERNDSWYLGSVRSRYFDSYGHFAQRFMLPNPSFLGFAPGGNYILTRERVHRYAVDFYEELRGILPYSQRPGEAMMVERTYHTLWS